MLELHNTDPPDWLEGLDGERSLYFKYSGRGAKLLPAHHTGYHHAPASRFQHLLFLQSNFEATTLRAAAGARKKRLSVRKKRLSVRKKRALPCEKRRSHRGNAGRRPPAAAMCVLARVHLPLEGEIVSLLNLSRCQRGHTVERTATYRCASPCSKENSALFLGTSASSFQHSVSEKIANFRATAAATFDVSAPTPDLCMSRHAICPPSWRPLLRCHLSGGDSSQKKFVSSIGRSSCKWQRTGYVCGVHIFLRPPRKWLKCVGACACLLVAYVYEREQVECSVFSPLVR